MKRTSIRIVVSLALALLLGHVALTWEFIPGLLPFGSFSGGPFDIVNNANLNVHFVVPVLNKAGRGLPFSYAERYDSTIWQVHSSAWTPVTNWGWLNGAFEPTLGFVFNSQQQGSCTSGGQVYYYNVYAYWQYQQPANPGTLTDTNGNQITATVPASSVLTDTLGTTAITASGQGTPSSPITFQYTNAAGT